MFDYISKMMQDYKRKHDHNTATLSRKLHLIDQDKNLSPTGRDAARETAKAQYEEAVNVARKQVRDALMQAFEAMRTALSAAVTRDSISADDIAYIGAMEKMSHLTQEHFDTMAERFKRSYMADQLLTEVARAHELEYAPTNVNSVINSFNAAETFCQKSIERYQGIDHRGAMNSNSLDLYTISAFSPSGVVWRGQPNELTVAAQNFERFAEHSGAQLPAAPDVPTNPLDEPNRISQSDYLDMTTGERFRGFVG